MNMTKKAIIYADNAATTKLDIDAFEAMKPYFLDDFFILYRFTESHLSCKDLQEN